MKHYHVHYEDHTGTKRISKFTRRGPITDENLADVITEITILERKVTDIEIVSVHDHMQARAELRYVMTSTVAGHHNREIMKMWTIVTGEGVLHMGPNQYEKLMDPESWFKFAASCMNGGDE